MRAAFCSLLIGAAVVHPAVADTNGPVVVAVLRVDGLGDSFAEVDRAATQSGFGTLLPAIAGAMEKGLGAPGLAGVDTNGTLNLCVVLVAKEGAGMDAPPSVRLVHTATARDRYAYVRAVSEELGPAVEAGSLLRFDSSPGGAGPLWVSMGEDGHVVAGPEEESVAHVAGLLRGEQGGLPEPHELPCGIRLVAHIPRLRPVLKRVLSNAKRWGAGFGLAVPDGENAAPGDADDAPSPLDSVERFTIGFSAGAFAVEIRTALTPAPGGELAACVSGMAAPSERCTRGIPGNAHAVFAGTGFDCAEKVMLPFLKPLRKKTAGDDVMEHLLEMENTYAGEIAAGIVPGAGSDELGFVQVAALVEEGPARTAILAALRKRSGTNDPAAKLGEESVRVHGGHEVHSYPLRQGAVPAPGGATNPLQRKPEVVELAFADGYAISVAGSASIMNAVLDSWDSDSQPFPLGEPFATLFPDGAEDAVNLFAGRLVQLAAKILANMPGVNPAIVALIPPGTGGMAGYTRIVDGDLLGVTRIATDELAAAQGIALLAGGIAAQATLAPSSFGRAGGPDAAPARCRAHLRRIRAAKAQWALEKELQAGAAVSKRTLSRYLPKGRMPTCPSGGVYSVNRVGTDPTCSVPGHVLK